MGKYSPMNYLNFRWPTLLLNFILPESLHRLCLEHFCPNSIEGGGKKKSWIDCMRWFMCFKAFKHIFHSHPYLDLVEKGWNWKLPSYLSKVKLSKVLVYCTRQRPIKNILNPAVAWDIFPFSNNALYRWYRLADKNLLWYQGTLKWPTLMQGKGSKAN